MVEPSVVGSPEVDPSVVAESPEVDASLSPLSSPEVLVVLEVVGVVVVAAPDVVNSESFALSSFTSHAAVPSRKDRPRKPSRRTFITGGVSNGLNVTDFSQRGPWRGVFGRGRDLGDVAATAHGCAMSVVRERQVGQQTPDAAVNERARGWARGWAWGQVWARAENDHGASAQSSPRCAMKGCIGGLLAWSRIPHLAVRTETKTVVRIFCPRDRERVQPRRRGALEGRACNGVRGEVAHSVLVKRWGVRVDVANDPSELNPSQRRDLSRLEIGGTADLRGPVTEVLPVEGRGVGDEEQTRCPRNLIGRT